MVCSQPSAAHGLRADAFVTGRTTFIKFSYSLLAFICLFCPIVHRQKASLSLSLGRLSGAVNVDSR